MSWTVQQDDSLVRSAASATIPDANLEEILQKVVDEDDEGESKSSPYKQQQKHNGSNQPTGYGVSSSYTKSSHVFSPPPLTPSDLQNTPVKDPLESFNSWVRTQTPTSSRNSPTPTGAGLPTSASSPPSAQRPPALSSASGLQPNAAPFLANLTPQKFGNEAYSNPSASPSALQGQYRAPRPQLETIMEHRKQLILQMEELALQELELRQNGGAVPGNAPVPQMLMGPHVNQQGMMPGNGLNQGFGSMGSFQEWSPNAISSNYQQPHHNHGSQGMMNAFSNGITADNIRGRVYETAKDQHGCRFLQRWLDTNYDGEAVQVIMSEIIPHVAELMTDQYANFLVQKLFDIMPHDIRYSVAQVAAPHIAHIALTPHGTFSVQKLIETIATREEMEVIRESLSHEVVRLVKDVHGNHVIQKVLQRFEHPDKEFIYEAVSTDCAAIATNKQGCCVLQRCLEFASPSQHKALVACILQVCLQIVQDPFGNYVLQYVLEANEPGINDVIAKAFMPHLVPLCMNKFSSNVMEKVLRGATLPVRDAYVDTMRNPDIVASLMQDDFGNYVLQTALTMSSPNQSEALVAVIRPLMAMIKNSPYAKKLEAKMDLIMKKKCTGPSQRGGYVARGPQGGPIASSMEYDAPPPHHHHHQHHRGGYGGGQGNRSSGYRANHNQQSGGHHNNNQSGGWQN